MGFKTRDRDPRTPRARKKKRCPAACWGAGADPKCPPCPTRTEQLCEELSGAASPTQLGPKRKRNGAIWAKPGSTMSPNPPGSYRRATGPEIWSRPAASWDGFHLRGWGIGGTLGGRSPSPLKAERHKEYSHRRRRSFGPRRSIAGSRTGKLEKPWAARSPKAIGPRQELPPILGKAPPVRRRLSNSRRGGLPIVFDLLEA